MFAKSLLNLLPSARWVRLLLNHVFQTSSIYTLLCTDMYGTQAWYLYIRCIACKLLCILLLVSCRCFARWSARTLYSDGSDSVFYFYQQRIFCITSKTPNYLFMKTYYSLFLKATQLYFYFLMNIKYCYVLFLDKVVICILTALIQ